MDASEVEIREARSEADEAAAATLMAAYLAWGPLTPNEEGFIATLTRCCAKNAEFAAACVA